MSIGGKMEDTFIKDLEECINRHSQENISNTPDFILAAFLHKCLQAWNEAVQQREEWYQGEKVFIIKEKS